VRGTRSCCVWQSIALKLLMLLFFSFFSPNFRTPVQIGKETIKFSLASFPNRPEEDAAAAAAAAEGYCRCCSLQLHFIQELFCGSRNPPPPPRRELWSLLVLVVVLLLRETQ
jgi:hypothetical protein